MYTEKKTIESGGSSSSNLFKYGRNAMVDNQIQVTFYVPEGRFGIQVDAKFTTQTIDKHNKT